MEGRQYITVAEIQAEILPVSKKIIRRIITQNSTIPMIRNGRRLLVSRQGLIEYIEQHNNLVGSVACVESSDVNKPVMNTVECATLSQKPISAKTTTGYGIKWN